MVVFTVYLSTICPTVFLGDCGELTAAAALLGIGHPPGYPLFCLLGKLFSCLPLSEIAFRVNLMAGTCSAFAVVLVYLLTLKLIARENPAPGTVPILAAAVSALAFAFSDVNWAQSVMAKGGIYTLNSLLLCLALYLLAVWSVSEKITSRNILVLFSFVYGTSLANHNTMGLFGPIFFLFGLWVLYETRGKSFWKYIPYKKILLAFASGLLIYAYLYIRAQAKPAMNWGSPETLPDVWGHITRQQYGALNKNPRSLYLFFDQLRAYAEVFWSQFYWFSILAVFGIKKLWREDKRWLILLAAGFLATSLGFVILLNSYVQPDMNNFNKVFYIPSFMITAVLIGLGITELASFIRRNLFRILASAAGLAVPVFLFLGNFRTNDMHKDRTAMVLGYNFFRTMPPGSTIFSSADNPLFALVYIQMVEKRHMGISIYDDYALLFRNDILRDFTNKFRQGGWTWLNQAQKQIISSTPGPVFFSPRSSLGDISGLVSRPVGLLYQVVKNPEIPEAPVQDFWTKYDLAGLDDPFLSRDYFHREVFGLYHLARAENYAAGSGHATTQDIERALEEYKKAGDIAYDVVWVQRFLGATLVRRNFLDDAIRTYERLLKLTTIFPDSYNNMGVAYYRKAIECLEKKTPVDAGRFLDQAAMYYKKSLSIEDSADLRNNLGVIYNLRGKKEEAIKEWRRAYSLNPTLVEVRRNLTSIGVTP